MGLALPDWRLVHPWALHPGRKPTGPIAGKNLVGCVFLTDGLRDFSGNNNDMQSDGIPFARGGYDFLSAPRGDRLYKLEPIGLPAGSSDAFTIVCAFFPRDYVSLAGVFGFSGRPGVLINPNNGSGRLLIQFNNNYYFWGSAADWDTGVPYDTDGRHHVVAISSSASDIEFWRDGEKLASGARPSLTTLSGFKYAEAGNGHDGASTGPNLNWRGGAIFNRKLPATDLRSITTNFYTHCFGPA